MGDPSEQGGRVQVVRVSAGSPAEAGGIQRAMWDCIDGTRVSNLEQFYKRLGPRHSGG